MLLHFNAQICIILCWLLFLCVCYCIAVGIIMSLCYLRRKLTLNFFSAPSLHVCSQLLSKCRLLITFENMSGPTKCSCENACMCSLVSALAAQDESVIHVHVSLITGFSINRRLNFFLKVHKTFKSYEHFRLDVTSR